MEENGGSQKLGHKASLGFNLLTGDGFLYGLFTYHQFFRVFSLTNLSLAYLVLSLSGTCDAMVMLKK